MFYEQMQYIKVDISILLKRYIWIVQTISWEEADKYVQQSLSWADGIMGKFMENCGKFSMYTKIYTSFVNICIPKMYMKYILLFNKQVFLWGFKKNRFIFKGKSEVLREKILVDKMKK